MNRSAVMLAGILITATVAASAQNAPAVGDQRASWNLGELIYGRTYHGTLTVNNHCSTEQRVLIVNDGIPDLSIAKVVTLPPNARVAVPYVILPILHRGRLQNESVRGEVIVWHPRHANTTCAPFRIVHQISGRVRTATFEDVERDGRALEAAAIEAACDVWWIRSENPAAALSRGTLPAPIRRAVATVDELRCTAAIRNRVTQLRRRLLDEAQPPDANAWRWLPDEAAISRASMADLVAIRRRMANQFRKRR